MDRKLLCVLFLCVPILVASKKHACEQNLCHPIKHGYINVHVIAHTHDDVGWTKTVDEYYFDLREPSYGGVKQILTSSVEALRVNSQRRFMYVESSFLFKWWNEQSPIVKKEFKKLINNGQLELVSGAWSMNDEATTNYQSIIDQFTLGLIKINDTFGVCGRPKVGWQIDPFGHSNEMASIFAHLGFDGLFLGRIDYQDKEIRFKTKSAEMLWQGSRSLKKNSEIFTSVLYNTYWPPNGFCFDNMCGYNDLEDKDMNYKWSRLVKYMDKQASVYRTKNIILTMGGDFHFMAAHKWFKNLDKIISYGNAQQKYGSQYNLLYSTPSCYLKAVRNEATKAKIKWPTKNDDFFPYASDEFSYWTGFYTSRPALKRIERMGNNFLQVCKQLYVLGGLNETFKSNLNSLQEAMGNLQHHDAVSGTEQQHVANDYVKTLSKAFDDCLQIASESLNNLLPKTPGEAQLPFTTCLLTNISQCQLSENSTNFIVTIYNPLSRPVDHYVRIPVTKGRYSVRGPHDEIPPVQMVPIPLAILNIPGRTSEATLDLIFSAIQIPPLGYKCYYVIKNSKDKRANEDIQNHPSVRKISVRIGKKSGFLTKVIINKKTIPIQQRFYYYQGSTYPPRSSGAYVFLPKTDQATPISQNATTGIHKGAILTEIHQTFNQWVSQVVKVYHNENYVELQWLVGPLPQNVTSPREVISRFSTKLNTESTFYTDSNGRELQKRVINSRPSWNLNITQPVAGNYYPVTSRIVIRDPEQNIEVAVLTDRSQGGSSLNNGEIELMVHRNSFEDDGLGVDEALNEEAFGKPLVVRGSHYLLIGSYKDNSGDSLAAIEKDVAQKKLLDSWTFLSPTNGNTYQTFKILYNLEYSGLNSALPQNVQILTLEPRTANTILLRLEHIFEKHEKVTLSAPVQININGLFSAFKIIDMRETTLGGNQWLDEHRPFKFDVKDDVRKSAKSDHIRIVRDTGKNNRKTVKKTPKDKFKITLAPMQIRTFIVTIGPNN